MARGLRCKVVHATHQLALQAVPLHLWFSFRIFCIRSRNPRLTFVWHLATVSSHKTSVQWHSAHAPPLWISINCFRRGSAMLLPINLHDQSVTSASFPSPRYPTVVELQASVQSPACCRILPTRCSTAHRGALVNTPPGTANDSWPIGVSMSTPITALVGSLQFYNSIFQYSRARSWRIVSLSYTSSHSDIRR